MGKARARAGAAGRLAALLEAGDHGLARREALGLLADAGAPEGDRAAAGALLESLRPERAAVLVGAGGLAAAVAVLAWLVSR
jgi:hypothetical protein